MSTVLKKKYPSHPKAYNNDIKFKSNKGVRELEKAKFKNFLYLVNKKLILDKKTDKKYRYFRTRVLFNFRECQVTLSIDFIDKKINNSFSKKVIEKWFVDCFDYLSIDDKYSLIPNLTENMEVHFFDLYKKNEFKSLFSNIDLLREAVARANLAVGNGIYDILDLYSKIILQYPEMNQITSFNTKMYKLWLVIFQKVIILDRNVVEFCIRNFVYAVEGGFINKDDYSHLDKDIYDVLVKEKNSISDDFLFYFCYASTSSILFLRKNSLLVVPFFLKLLVNFSKKFSIGMENSLEKNLKNYINEALLLLAAYYNYQKDNKFSKQIFTYIQENYLPTFFHLMGNDNEVRRWRWAEWFQQKYLLNPFLSRTSLRECLLKFSVKQILQQKSYEHLHEIHYHEKDVETLEQIFSLIPKNTRKLPNILLDTIYQILEKKQAPLIKNRVEEIFHCFHLGYMNIAKLSDFIGAQIIDEVGKKITHKFKVKKQVFLTKHSFNLDDFISYGEDLAKIENKILRTKLFKKKQPQKISPIDFFQQILLTQIKDPKIKIFCFGNIYHFMQFFNQKNHQSIYHPDLFFVSSLKEKKKIYSGNYNLEIDIQSYAFNYQNQEKKCFFLPDGDKDHLDILFYDKQAELKISYKKPTNKENLWKHHGNYELLAPKNNLKLLKNNFLKNKKNLMENQMLTSTTRVEFALSIAPEIVFSQKKDSFFAYSIVE